MRGNKFIQMKIIQLVFSIFSLILLSSSVSLSGKMVEIGQEVPDFTITNSEASVRTHDLRGSEITITFWSANDPQTRIINKQMASRAASIGGVHIGICMDEDVTLFREILKRDGLLSQNQFMISHVSKGNPAKSFETASQLQTFHIDPYGIIDRIIR